MRITLICHEIPYPAIHGARIDAWRRVKAFSQFGVEQQLIFWYDEAPSSEDVVEMKKYVQDIIFIPYKKTIGAYIHRAIDILRYPLEVTSRILRGKELDDLVSQVRDFQPDIIWSDYVHCGELALALKENLCVPVVARSHNIEHLYYRRLLAATIDFKGRFKRYLSVAHLEKYEKELLKKCKFFYDISVDDRQFWLDLGFDNARYLPPFVEFPSVDELENKNYQYEYDIVFLGNLNIDNNVAGVAWLITTVLPIVRSTFPNVKVLIAGSKPVKIIQQLCEKESGVDLKINPPSSSEIYRSGRVLVNPVSTGSGVSIKSIEMLVSGRPIVSQPQGMSGLPDEVKPYFLVEREAEPFAAAIVKLLSNPEAINVDRKLMESLFGFQAIAKVIKDLEALIEIPVDTVSTSTRSLN